MPRTPTPALPVSATSQGYAAQGHGPQGYGAYAQPHPTQWPLYYYRQARPCGADYDEACDKRPERSSWYGGQTLIVDGLSLATFIAAVGGDIQALGVIGFLGYAAGPPIVHVAHGRWGAGLASVGMRAGLPLLGAAIGSGAADCHDHRAEGSILSCGSVEIGFGIVLGISAAIAIDAAVLARETVPDEDAAPVQSLRVSPVVDPRRQLAAVAVGGNF